MQGKNLIKFFAFALAIVCVYQLVFTWVAYKEESKAKNEAKAFAQQYGSFQASDSAYRAKKEEILEEVEFLGYEFPEIKEKSVKLGLDLQGGMSLTLQVSLVDLIKAMTINPQDSLLNRALNKALQMQQNNNEDFVTLFQQAWEEISPNDEYRHLKVLFSTPDNEIDPNETSKEEIFRIIREESKQAFERSYEIIKTRIDKFGVSQPNITREPGTGRIMVELPGIDAVPDRIRRNLQSSAKLEFWEAYSNRELYRNFVAADQKLADILKTEGKADEKETAGEEAATEEEGDEELLDELLTEEQDVMKSPDDTGEVAMFEDRTEADTGLEGLLGDEEELTDEDLLGGGASPLMAKLSVAGMNTYTSVIGTANVEDTAQINSYLSRDNIRSLFPANVRFLWSASPVKDNENQYELYAIEVKSPDGKAPLEGDVITDARSDVDQTGKNIVSLRMNPEGAAIWKDLTRRNKGQFVAIVLDDQVYSAPVVQNEIPGGNTQISGTFSVKEATDLSSILKIGKLPTRAKIIDEAIVGPTLGRENIRASLYSLLIGLALVLAFIIYYYNRGGIISDIALFINVFFIVGVLASLGFTITLPGVAGLILTIGMAIDANVIIFERIKEELAKGKSMKNAVLDGYKNSYSAIIDANVTTLITALILWYFGTGPLLGFAVVLTIGIFCSFFTGVLLTQVFFRGRLAKNKTLSFSNKNTETAFKNLNINFLSKRKFSYVISTVVIVVGIVSIVTKGFDFGVEFQGGRSYVVELDKHAEVPEVENALAQTFGSQPVVRTIKSEGNRERFKITTSYLINETGQTMNADSMASAALYSGLQPFYDQGVSQRQFERDKIIESRKVESSIADDIQRSAVWATVFGLIGIFLYILLRFQKWQYGLGAVVALLHDVLIVMGIFSIFSGILPFSLEIDQAFIAALLTIIGYSINDTVVIFDRIREYLFESESSDTKGIINNAINSTLSRTIMTSLTTFIVIFVLLLFGGESIKGFAFALLVGIITGTYSSAFIASPIIVDFSKKKEAVTSEEPRPAGKKPVASTSKV